MIDATKFYIGGAWQSSASGVEKPVVDPATGEPITSVAIGTAADADLAVAAARQAFPGYSRTTVAERLELLEAINARVDERNGEIAEAISTEMGAPIALAREAQAP